MRCLPPARSSSSTLCLRRTHTHDVKNKTHMTRYIYIYMLWLAPEEDTLDVQWLSDRTHTNIVYTIISCEAPIASNRHRLAVCRWRRRWADKCPSGRPSIYVCLWVYIFTGDSAMASLWCCWCTSMIIAVGLTFPLLVRFFSKQQMQRKETQTDIFRPVQHTYVVLIWLLIPQRYKAAIAYLCTNI